MGRRPTFVPGQSRAARSRKDYNEHIAYELELLQNEYFFNQLELAKIMGFANGSQLSRILRLEGELTLQRAKQLDEADLSRAGMADREALSLPKTSLGVTFFELAQERNQATKHKVGVPTQAAYDVFLASPMASVDSGAYSAERHLVLGVKDALEAKGLSVYCAALSIADTKDFDANRIAMETNWDALRKCKELVLFVPGPLKGPSPSSVWVEIGMALALSMPCSLFVSNSSVLPYVLRQALVEPGGFAIDVSYYDADPNWPASVIRRNGRTALAGGRQAR